MVDYLSDLCPECIEDRSILIVDLKEAFVTEDVQDRDILFVLVRSLLLVFLQDIFEKVFEVLAIMEGDDDSDVIPACDSFDDLLKHIERISRVRVYLFLLGFEKFKLRRRLKGLLLFH